MKHVTKLQGTIFVVLLAAAIFLGAYILYNEFSGKYDTDGGLPDNMLQDAADFTVYDKDGNAVKLSDFEGKPVVVNFWASWCQPCQLEMPYFQIAYETYHDEIAFLMVNLCGYNNDTRDDADALIDAMQCSFPVYYDDDASAAEAYAIRSIPVSLFIDEEGKLVSQRIGGVSEEKLQGYLNQLLD